jgi:hypothetical protein
VTTNETWLYCTYHYDPETKKQSLAWRHTGSSRPKEFRVQKPTGEVLASIFWDHDGILVIDYLPNSQTINAEYYSSLVVQLKDVYKGEKTAGSSLMGSCSRTIMSRLTVHLQPRRNWPTLASNVLITHHILRIWPRWTTTPVP